ncbi:hypothetical protein WPS_31350 [Vulcanimicrobium alpinum]|uniref:Uncharacterized protein n=1 Tax=Vulcanimicrobium alpinum TaxID=3016050 RepID=A0AAN2CAZ0_UNVUL|nr:hypothetical protein [Vulcanimicrobium alpinum]BDE07859.1 hypothetical protein WPS_31350 [Vulcanimicrobium alpinum]
MLQGALIRAVRDFGDTPEFASGKDRALATAASLDYVLMLVRGAAGARILERDAQRAIKDGVVRAVDDLIASATAIVAVGSPEAHAFAREAVSVLRAALAFEGLATHERRFALIALANP